MLISLLLGQAQCFLALPGNRSCPTRAPDAARCCRRALALEPTHAVALFRLGEALEAQQQFGAAKRFMSKAARSVRASGGDGGGGGAAAATPDVPRARPLINAWIPTGHGTASNRVIWIDYSVSFGFRRRTGTPRLRDTSSSARRCRRCLGSAPVWTLDPPSPGLLLHPFNYGSLRECGIRGPVRWVCWNNPSSTSTATLHIESRPSTLTKIR